MEKQELQTNPQSLIALAIEKQADIQQLEKLMELQAKWEAKEARKHFFDAMAKFQSEKPEIKKNSKVSFKNKAGTTTAYNFATLPQIQKQIDPVLTKYNLSYSFETTEENGRLNVACVVTHKLGHIKKFKLSAPNDTSGGKNPIQSIGSTNSYLQRYTLCNAFGISAEQDNDGQTSEPAPKALTEKDIKVLKGKLATMTTKKQLADMWTNNPQYKTSKEAHKLFTERQIEIQNADQ